jgi:hypothetical protein
VQEYYRFNKTVVTNFNVVEEKLFDEFSCMKKYCEGKLKEWNQNSGMTYGDKWRDIFYYFTEESIHVKTSVIWFNLHLLFWVQMLHSKPQLNMSFPDCVNRAHL